MKDEKIQNKTVKKNIHDCDFQKVIGEIVRPYDDV